MTIAAPPSRDPKSQLRRTMGFWDVLLFNIATVLGPRWIAAAGHNGPSSISLWVLAAVFFFVPGALVINELSSRFPEEGGLYAWARDAFGPFHGFIAGWTYWIYTVFYFPGLLLASASMSAYISSSRGAALAQDRAFLLWVSLALLLVAVVLNIIGLNIGKWLQNAGGVGTYLPLLILVGVAVLVCLRHGSATHFTLASMRPTWNWDTVNFWSQIAFAFTGLELVSCMAKRSAIRAALCRAPSSAPARSSPSCTLPEPSPSSRSRPRPTSIPRAASFTPSPPAPSCCASASLVSSPRCLSPWATRAALVPP